ncbi:MAG: universal stress protein [Aquificae bacterium]|nr:universal stress protein [Aquificota bacterium]
MKITLVLSDSSAECRKALETLAKYGELFSAEVEVLVVLEDLYRLESASVSLGVPLPPDTVKSAKERTENKIQAIWRHIKNDERARVSIKAVAGELGEEVVRFAQEEKPDMFLWGCPPTSVLCGIIDRINIPMLIIK